MFGTMRKYSKKKKRQYRKAQYYELKAFFRDSSRHDDPERYARNVQEFRKIVGHYIFWGQRSEMR